ncbi:MAG: TetR family transcriptional regulator [Myxococcales bacterium]|nr:TetR family transcriptional regulator [Myxococcales bacterium]
MSARSLRKPAAPARGSEAVRDALVASAAVRLAEVGPKALSVRDVARRAGVNHGQVHHYFGGKRALLMAAMRKLAAEHFARASERAGDDLVPPPLSLSEDRDYWRALCQVLMDGDLELARLEIDEGISVPRRVISRLLEDGRVPEDDLDIRARFALAVTLQLGWAAFEDFGLMAAGVDEEHRDEIRSRLKDHLAEEIRKAVTWTSD